MARPLAILRRALTLWLTLQLLAGSLAALANAQPLWSSFLEVLDLPACIEPAGEEPGKTPPHPPSCILCLALGGTALATLPVAAPTPAYTLAPRPLPILRLESEAGRTWSLDSTRSCRGPPAGVA